MKQLHVLLVSLLIAVNANAQRIQVVDTDGLPIAAVCVTNEKGALVGSTDNDGWLDDSKGTKHLYFSHVAFKPVDVNIDTIPSKTVVMQDENFQLSELEVKPKELLYVQTYYRCVYVCDEGPLYFRAGVVDNTYELAKQKISAKTRSVSRGKGIIRFLLSTLVGHYIDKWARIDTTTRYKMILKGVDNGSLFIAEEPSGRRVVSDTISVLGYIDDDMMAGQRTTSFDIWTYDDHIEATNAAAKAAKTGKMPKQKKKEYTTNHGYFELYNINENGQSRIDDLVMKQILVSGHFERTDQDYVMQTRKENEVEMDINELRRLEQVHHIPPLAPNLKAAVDELFKKDLND